MDDCIRWMERMAWPTSLLSRDTLVKMRNEWNPLAETREASARSEGSIREETVRQLQDPNSEMAKLLKEMGWSAPSQSQPAAPTPAVAPPNLAQTFTPLPWDTSVPLTNIDNIDRRFC
jgi:hypothetical protein